jgi:2-keto-4-pentenoate hydratase
MTSNGNISSPMSEHYRASVVLEDAYQIVLPRDLAERIETDVAATLQKAVSRLIHADMEIDGFEGRRVRK